MYIINLSLQQKTTTQYGTSIFLRHNSFMHINMQYRLNTAHSTAFHMLSSMKIAPVCKTDVTLTLSIPAYYK